MRVLFCGSGWLPMVDTIRDRVPRSVEVLARDFSRSFEEQLATAEVILPSNARIKAEQIDAAKAVRLIQQPAVGHDGIDKAAAAARGIPVCNAPRTNGEAVAEAALFLMLAVARKLNTAHRGFTARVMGEPVGRELSRKTLLLVGRGESGGRLKAIAEGLGMQTRVVHSKSARSELEAHLAEADFVSIHCPLTKETRGLFDESAFAHMKPGAILVNCARGPIVDRAALEGALDKLGGVGLDVFWREPWDPEEPLFEHPKVVTTPHLGGSTAEAFGRIADIVAENIRRLDTGEPLLHRVV